MAKTMYYGVVDKRHLVDIAKAVCEVLGNGNGYAVPMLVETCAAETLLATFKDPTRYGAGTSCMQVDEGTFDWLKDKFKGRMDNDLLKKAFNIDLAKVEYRELELSPVLGMIFARLRYKTVPESIPATLEGRAAYWKQHYNSYHPNAAGSSDGYISKCAKCDTATLLGSL